ncbi:MAG: protein kinase, partial [Planctomycetaceae bacterium]|nr:protein kinase [Planctomycetaceae bacterium]
GAEFLEPPTVHRDDSAPASTAALRGRRIGSCELQELLGEGGMGAVYSAVQAPWGRHVAVKVMRGLPGPAARQRFAFEARVLANLHHPGIAQIHEFGVDEDAATGQALPYFVMEFVAGAQRLDEWCLRQRLSIEERCRLVEDVCDAVHHGHLRGVIHRDLKPANVLFTADGKPMITDFGLAKVQHDRVVASGDATQSGESIGTPRYMAPEQAAGKLDRLCPATDVHALGAILYECLTGRAPFMASSVLETLQQICHDDPVPPRRIQAGIPRDLETICLQCLNKHAELRYRSAIDLADDLRHFLNGEPINARRTSAWERAVKWCRRKPAQATLLIGSTVLALTAVLSLFFMSMAHKSALAKQRAEISHLLSDGQRALENNDASTAMQHFEAAWLIVQSDPEFSDHETSVSGWLEHCRNLASRDGWQDRLPPPTLDVRRDEALLESLLITPQSDNPIQAGIDSIVSVREFVPGNDARWQFDLTLLAVQEAALTELSEGPEAALAVLDRAGSINSRLFHSRRAKLLATLRRSSEAEAETQRAMRFPANTVMENLQSGMDAARVGEFDKAIDKFQQVLDEEPEHFAARLFQSVCYVKLNHPSEARIGLTACVAQRPHFQWTYYFRAEAELQLDDLDGARRDLQRASQSRTENLVSQTAFALLQSIDSQSLTRSPQE